MKRAAILLLVVSLTGTVVAAQRTRPAAPQAAAPYFPARHEWQTREPAQAGFDAVRLQAAIEFALKSENPATKDLAVDLATTFGREPFDTPIGPIQPRGSLNGLIIRHGYVVAEWGDTARVDMTFSVTKSFLSTVVGLAWQKGLIRDVNDRVRDYVPGTDLFASEHNAKITWDHLLRQTSDWQGTLWGKPDWADRPEGQTPADWPNRKVSEPGTRYKYNDVRVNVLALAALHVLRRPLPQVLREEIMDPIGASPTWRWYGYDNAWIDLDGQKVQSMTGGGHWGGGMFISARDMARFGYLFLRNGAWNGRELVSPAWIAMARTPGAANATYGYMNWFLNTDRKPLPNASATAVTFQGNGSNIVYIDWENDVVIVVRWIQQRALNEFIGQVLGALQR
ncbi:MAG TPA: serine hydrolase [Vicinamibacterales bacterium]|nr:serine hydrolase [Vicinamibacterales bacterium]